MIMGLAINWWAAGILSFATFFYAVIYTVWLKRSTAQNIVIGGAAGAFPPVIGWTAVTGDPFALLPWLMFALIFIWTPPHFWALSLITNEDYEKAGVPMLPVVHGEARTRRDILLYTIALAAVSALFIPLGFSSPLYLIGAGVLNGIFLIGAVQLCRRQDRQTARRLFGYSILYLFAHFGLLMLPPIL
jgi:protoheme IX farnesyltransferase